MDDLMELPDYLLPEFQPSSVTVPRLRNILLENNVPSGSVVQKAQLVALFNEHVAPKVRRLRAARVRATRSSFGIINADYPDDDHSSADVDQLKDRPQNLARSRSRRRTPALTPEPPQLEVQPRSTVRRTRSTIRDENQLTAKKSVRSKSRRQTEVDSKQETNEEPVGWRNPVEGSPFSLDNPFQSGTPAPKKRTPSGGSSRPKSRVSSVSASRHRIPELFTPATQQRSKSYREELSDSDIDDVIHSQLQAIEVESHDVPSPWSRSIRPRKSSVWTFIIALSAVLFAVWRQEKLRVGYCEIGEKTTTIASFELPDWVDYLRPTCEFCPQHAFCEEKMATQCEPGFLLQNHPLSLGGLIPLVPSCESDGEQALKVKAVVHRILKYLRSFRAAYECKFPVTKDGPIPTSPEVTENQLKSSVGAMRRKSLSPEAFEKLWESSLGEVYREPDVRVRHEDSVRFISSSSLAGVPFVCSVRRWFRRQVGKYLVPGILILSTLLIGIYGRYRYFQNRQLDEYAELVAAQVFRQLANQAYNNSVSPDRFPEKFLGMANLRDDILRDEFSATKREKRWRPVQKKVEQNSNVRLSVREMQHGDVARVWEWIGAIRPIEDDDFGFQSSEKHRRSLSSSRSRLSMLHQDMIDGDDDSPSDSGLYTSMAQGLSTDGADPSPLTARWRDQGGARKSLNADELVAKSKLKREGSNSSIRDSAKSRPGQRPSTGRGNGAITGRPPFVV